jgi:hypothetical protein
MDIFGAPWLSLRQEHVIDFLADQPEDEGLYWEVKRDPGPERGGAKRLREPLEKAVCGMANSEGGFVIVGAEWNKQSKRWEVTGFDPGNGEPRTWLAQLVDASFADAPAHDIQTWALDDHAGRHLGVIRVEPTVAPPCVTVGGAVYRRLSGLTVPVQDNAVLTRLLERGDSVRRGMDEAVRQALSLTLPTAPLSETQSEHSFVTIGLAAPGYSLPVEAAVFQERMEQLVQALLTDAARLERRNDKYQCRTHVHADRISLVGPRYWSNENAPPVERLWVVSVFTSGAVSVHCRLLKWRSSFEHLLGDIIGPAFQIAAHVQLALGARGELALGLGCVPTTMHYHEHGIGHDSDRKIVRVERGRSEVLPAMASGDALSQLPVGVLTRHLQRSVGVQIWEPELPAALV